MALSAAPALVLGAAPRVNLMPRAEVERREAQKLVGQWIRGVLATLIIVVVASALTFWLQTSAQHRLDAENARSAQLLDQVAALQPVNAKLMLETELTQLRADAMATDMSWAALTTTIEQKLPASAEISGFALTAGGAPATTEPTSEIGAAGTLTLTSEDPTDVVALVRQLRGVAGILSVDSWSASAVDDAFEYTIRIVFDQSFYSGRFAAGAEQ